MTTVTPSPETLARQRPPGPTGMIRPTATGRSITALPPCGRLAVTVSMRFDTCQPRGETSKLIVPSCDVCPA